MNRLLFFFTFLPFCFVLSASAQWTPPPSTSPTYGVHPPNVQAQRDYERGNAAIRRNQQSLNRYAPKSPALSRGAEYLWPTPELQMQQESLAIQEYEAGTRPWGSASSSDCDSWSLRGC